MMQYNDFKDLFNDICNIKKYVVKLWGKELREYRNKFYELPFPEWRLNLLWEYCWGDISYAEVRAIFRNSKII